MTIATQVLKTVSSKASYFKTKLVKEYKYYQMIFIGYLLTRNSESAQNLSKEEKRGIRKLYRIQVDLNYQS